MAAKALYPTAYSQLYHNNRILSQFIVSPQQYSYTEIDRMGAVTKFLFYAVASLVALLAIGLGKYAFVLKRWQNVDHLTKGDFKNANFNIHQESDISTTYYEPGKLGEVLQKV
jgi:hypothetical protein